MGTVFAYFRRFDTSIPIAFVLGFWVTQIFTRW